MIYLHDLADTVLHVRGEGQGGIGRKIVDPDALGDDLDGLLGHDAHPSSLRSLSRQAGPSSSVPAHPQESELERERERGEEEGKGGTRGGGGNSSPLFHLIIPLVVYLFLFVLFSVQLAHFTSPYPARKQFAEKPSKIFEE